MKQMYLLLNAGIFKRNSLLLLAAMLLLGATGYAQAPVIQWEKLLGGSDFEGGSLKLPIEKTSDGGYILVGITASPVSGDVTGTLHGTAEDLWVVKLDANGNKLWDKVLGGSGDEEPSAIHQTSDGGYILTAYSRSSVDGDVTGTNHALHPVVGAEDVWIVKLRANGTKEWDKLIGGSGADIPWDLHQTSDGYILVAASTSSNDGDVSDVNRGITDYWVVKLDDAGNILWDKLLGGPGVDYGYSVAQTTEGGYIVSGYTESASGGDLTGTNHGGRDYWVVKLEADGDIEWDKLLGGDGDESSYTGILQTNDGGYIVSGHSTSSANGDVSGINHGDGDYWLVKLDAGGDIEWDKLFGGSLIELNFGIDQTSDGGYITGGYTYSSATGDVSGTNGGVNYWIVKVDAMGNKLWDKLMGGNGGDAAFNIQETTPGEFIMAGYTGTSANGDVSGTNHGVTDLWIVKLEPATTLPVTLSAFNATKQGDVALLTWTTASEQNNKGFNIQRSADGIHWNAIGSVNSKAANGNSNLSLSYSFTDPSPLTGINYYRLQQTDLDGRRELSTVKKVDFGAVIALRIYPNPVINNDLHVQGLTNNSILTISNTNGQVLIRETVTNSNSKTVNMGKLPKGTYILQVVNENGVPTNRTIIKQ